MLGTPFSTPSQQAKGAVTPHGGGTALQVGGVLTPALTPSVRDRLNINKEDDIMVDYSDPNYMKQQQLETQHTLKKGLALLPTPRNDYEIVVPEDERPVGPEQSDVEIPGFVEDAADREARRLQELEQQRAAEFKLRSQAVQRGLPHPSDINHAILRPPNQIDSSVGNLQKAEELIKQEMVIMQHHDALYANLSDQDARRKQLSAMSQAHHMAYLEGNHFEKFSKDELLWAKKQLQAEMEVVKQGMSHGDLSLDAYTQVWQECNAQVMYLPIQNRFTRANLASKKDRIESLEKRLENNRDNMTKEARHAVKLEKKLKVLLGGYQARAQGFIRQLHETNEQLEQAYIEINTFSFLKEQETAAIPRRLQSLTEDVQRQMERESELQKRYYNLWWKKSEMSSSK